jgi:fibronectin type 3 domain-containing protein
VGPVLPPSPQLPLAVTDLVAVERGDQIVIDFSTPSRTSDNLAVKHFSEIDLRIGPAAIPFDFDRWAAGAKRYPVTPPPPADPDNPVPVSISKKIPAPEWEGQRVAVAVRTAIKKKDHYSAWSNRVVLDVIAPLAPPQVKAKSTAKGVMLTWDAVANSSEYRIYRKSANDNAPIQLGTSKARNYLDTSSQYEIPYEYTVVAVRGLAESLPSRAELITTKDIFPPSVPSGVAVLAAPSSIELSWQRSPEADLKGYYVYRSENGGPYQGVGGLLNLPAYSDHQVEHGKTYRYQVSAVDQKNNASDRSAPVEIRF